MNKEILVGMIVFSNDIADDIEKKLEAEYRSLYKSFCQIIEMVPRHDPKYALDQLLGLHPEFLGKYTVVTDDIFGMAKIVGNYNETEYHMIFTNADAYCREFEEVFGDNLFSNKFGGSIWDIGK